MFWERRDLPGHDAARLYLSGAGPALTGTAVFLEELPTVLHYAIRCDGGWRTTEAAVRGWRGEDSVHLRLRRDSGGEWTLNDAACPAVAGCVDLDLSFTPATNLLPLRRLALGIGASAEVRSAWLEWPDVRLTPLVQRYARRTTDEFDYEADLPGEPPFVGVLRVDPEGWVLDYTGLWRAVVPGTPRTDRG